jgi:hypothetical protein
VLPNSKVCVITVVCNLRRIVQINFLVKSEESTFIVVALPSKTRYNMDAISSWLPFISSNADDRITVNAIPSAPLSF